MVIENKLEVSVIKDKSSEILKILNGFTYGQAKQILNDVYISGLECSSVITVYENWNALERGSGSTE